MADFLTLVNKVARRAGWDSTTSASFDDPGRPWDAYKDFLNESKDEILDELGIPVVEEEFVLSLRAPRGTGEGTISGTAGSTIVAGVGTLFSATDVGAKLISPGFDGWFRISGVGSGLPTETVVDVGFRSDFSAQTYEVVEDEYDLDARVRRVMSAWIDQAGSQLELVSEPFWMDRHFAANTNLGVPREMAIFRSSTTAQIWQAQFRPIPDNNYVVRIKAETRLADLVGATTFWEIAPEIETLIVDRALFKALNTPVHNDPDLALTTGADLGRRLNSYRNRHQDPNPARRLRRIGPDEAPQRAAPNPDRSRFH